MAKGILIELFQLAQEFWFPSRQLIPLDRFEAAGLPAVLYAPGGLCEIRGASVYVRGSDKAFSWLFEKSEAGKVGGRNSAIVRKEKYGTAQPGKKTKKRRSSLEAASKQPPNDTEAPEASLLSSLSSSLSTLNSNSLLSSDVVDVPEKELAKEGGKESVKNPITRFERQFSADREKFKDCFKYFVERSGDESLQSFITSQKLSEAIRAFEKPEECWSWLEGLADSIFENKPDSPLKYASASWRREISERLSDVGGVL